MIVQLKAVLIGLSLAVPLLQLVWMLDGIFARLPYLVVLVLVAWRARSLTINALDKHVQRLAWATPDARVACSPIDAVLSTVVKSLMSPLWEAVIVVVSSAQTWHLRAYQMANRGYA